MCGGHPVLQFGTGIAVPAPGFDFLEICLDFVYFIAGCHVTIKINLSSHLDTAHWVLQSSTGIDSVGRTITGI